MLSVLIESFHPLPRSLCLSLPTTSTAADILNGFQAAFSGPHVFTVAHNGRQVPRHTRLDSLAQSSGPLILQIRVPLRGGKGGFGAMLRSQGGKMSSGARKSNNDACRDLSGRRIGVMREAKELAKYLEGESERKKQMDEAQKQKYAKLERMLGRTPKSEKDLAEAADKMADAGQDFNDEETPNAEASSSKVVQKEAVAGSKRKERIEDSQYVEQSREIVENVRSAVATAMMKKKKKKLNQSKTDASTTSTSVPTST